MSTARSVRLALALLPLLAGCVDVPELGDSESNRKFPFHSPPFPPELAEVLDGD